MTEDIDKLILEQLKKMSEQQKRKFYFELVSAYQRTNVAGHPTILELHRNARK